MIVSNHFNATHGLRNDPIYLLWKTIINRTEWSGHIGYKNYGGRGIKMWPSWRVDPEAFVQYVYSILGPRPKDGQLDRIDNDKDYIPGNLRWATAEQQARNRRSTIMTLEKARELRNLREQDWKRDELAERFGISISTVAQILAGKTWRE